MHLYEIIFLCIMVFALDANKVSCFNKHHLKVCAKQKIKDLKKPSIDNETSNFKDFVVRSDMFVDKSLLIKSILEEKPLVSLTYPTKWGKSINLDMLKTFLEIEFDHKGVAIPINETWSYSFFKQGVIMDHNERREELFDVPMIARHDDIIEKYLARYLVIHIDLSSTPPVKNFHDYFLDFRNTIAGVLKKFDFVIDVIRDQMEDLTATDGADTTKRKNQLKKFKAYKRQEVSDYAEMVKSVRFLAALLHEYFQQRVIVLVDNYDAPIQIGYINPPGEIDSTDAQKFMNFYVDFMTSTFISDKDIAKGVLTGIFSLDMCSTPLLGLNRIVNYNAITQNMYPFYGFSAMEVRQLLAHTFSSEFITDVLNRYNGYHMLNFPDITIYNPGSIVDIVLKRKIDENWFIEAYAKRSHILSRVHRYEHAHYFFPTLISRSVDAKRRVQRRSFTLHHEDIISFSKMVSNESWVPFTSNEVALISILYFATGYLTIDFVSLFTNWDREIPVKIPCAEVERIIVKELEEYYRNTLSDEISSAAESTATIIIDFAENDNDWSAKRFQTFFTSLFKNSSLGIPTQNLIDFAYLYFVLHVRSSTNFEYNADLNATYYDDSGRKLTPLVTMYGKGVGIIYSFKYTDSDTDWLKDEQIAIHGTFKQYRSYFTGKPVTVVRSITLEYNLRTSWFTLWYSSNVTL